MPGKNQAMTATDSTSMMPPAMRLQCVLKHLQILGAPDAILPKLDASERAQIEYDWFGLWARDDQKPPMDVNWRNWLILGGRGAGKTRAGAEWVKARATGQGLAAGSKAGRIALVAPTFDEARMVMIEGVSGLLPFTTTVGGPFSSPRSASSPGPMAAWPRCSRRKSPMACGARSSMRPGAMSWRNGNRRRMPGTCCSSLSAGRKSTEP